MTALRLIFDSQRGDAKKSTAGHEQEMFVLEDYLYRGRSRRWISIGSRNTAIVIRDRKVSVLHCNLCWDRKNRAAVGDGCKFKEWDPGQ